MWVFLLVLGAVFLAAMIWLGMEMLSTIKDSKKRAKLSIDGRQEDLLAHLERRVKNPWPQRRLFQWLFRPGIEEAQYAIRLFACGRLEEALRQVDSGIRKATRRPAFLPPMMACRIQVLTGLGRYEEALKQAAELRRIPQVKPHLLGPEALLEAYLGHCLKSIKVAQIMLASDPRENTARTIAAINLSYLGGAREALTMLDYEPRGVEKFYSTTEWLERSKDPLFAELLELQDRAHRSIVDPGRWLMVAFICLDHGLLEEAAIALHDVENRVGKNAVIRRSFSRCRAKLAAQKGDAAAADDALRDLAAIPSPGRISRWEDAIARARVSLALGRLEKAEAELKDTQDLALHPFEQHVTSYWMGQLHLKAGRTARANECFQAVIQPGFGTWMERSARNASAKQDPPSHRRPEAQ